MARIRMGVAVVAAAWLLLAGCSSDDNDEATPTTESAASPADAGPQPSAGCGTTTVSPGVEKVTMTSGGVERWYLQHLPPAYDGEEPVPLVVDIHGYSEGAEFHATNSGLGEFGDTKGFVTITPQALGDVPFWDTALGSADLAFVGDLLDQVEETLCVDEARIYATGLSNGAMMTSSVACAYADRIAAVAPVAGVTQVEDCDPEQPVPVVAFHGTEDPFLNYTGGFGPAVASLPAPDGQGTLGDLSPEQQADMNDTAGATGIAVPDVMAGWADRNGCDADPPEETTEADDVTVLTFACPAGADVELYRIEGGGHTWPGSHALEGVDFVGKTTFSISANDVMWAFFQDHPLG
ncbi:MAG TPA: PHB depolymerase family esterase [Acidimicrobiales bacterium]